MTSEERRILAQAKEIRRRSRKKPEREPSLEEWAREHPEQMNEPLLKTWADYYGVALLLVVPVVIVVQILRAVLRAIS